MLSQINITFMQYRNSFIQVMIGSIVGIAAGVTVHAGWIEIAKDGHPQIAIVRQQALLPAELNAIDEFKKTLKEIIGSDIEIVEPQDLNERIPVYIGQGEQTLNLYTEIQWDKLDPEQVIIKINHKGILLAGGRARGTLYAVSTFLQKWCGVRWWTPWATYIPKNPNLGIPEFEYSYKPVFEYREPFWYIAFDPIWAVRNRVNGNHFRIPDEWGGCIRYKGFVHTFYTLVPPQEYYDKHPEWFSLIKGKRTADKAQLCLMNQNLREFVVKKVIEWIQNTPDINIVSVSQNDWAGACECEKCKEIDEQEGSHAGSLLDFVNYVANKIKERFPQTSIDTLAYQYTRRPPKNIRPVDNVIVRVCSIECNFREPLDAQANKTFLQDLIGWAEISKRLYVWDYTTDFANYLQPHPNWYVLGPNIRLFARSNVKGVFEQGAYQSHGAEFAELRAWVLAQLLWDPTQDDRQLIREFLWGYYGAAAPFIQEYMDLMWQSAQGYYMRCFAPVNAPYLNFKTLSKAEELWDKALAAVRGDGELSLRVRLGKVWLGSVWLQRWEQLKEECKRLGERWPLPESIKEYAQQWLTWAKGDPNKPWTQITLVREWGDVTPERFVEQCLK